MKIELEIPQYFPERGIEIVWEPDEEIHVNVDKHGAVVIDANSSGLRTLALHLLTLAQLAVPKGSHIHYDDDTGGLEKPSIELIICKA
jgi:hypothetical protein